MELGGAEDAMAKRMSDWLLDQDAVAELYLDDDGLARLLMEW